MTKKIENNSDSKTLVKVKKEKKKSVIKIPRLFKKSLTEKKLNKKILKRIYIADDKKFVSSLYKQTSLNKKGVALYSIPKDMMIEKKEQQRLKALAKEIKSQKGRIKFVPLFATIGAIFAVVLVVSIFKNRIVRKIIVNTCESIFEAKCDIDYVNLKIFDASFYLKRLQIANKNEPMKNLFECEKIVFNFDLTALIKGRFVTEEISITGMQTNTPRTYSGDISAKIAAKKAKPDSAFVKMVKARSNAALDSMKASFQGVFDKYNPINIIDECYQNMQTPAVAKQTEQKAKELITKYQAKPKEIETQINEIQKTANELASIDYNALKKDPRKIPATVKQIQKAKEDVDKVQKELTNIINDSKKDLNDAKLLAKNIQSSIDKDKNLLSSKINSLTSLNISDGKRFISSTLEGAGYQLLGKYYPYAIQGVNYLLTLKNKPKEPKKEDKINLLIDNRSKGRNVYYRKNPPKFWIKKFSVEGFNLTFNMRDISSDMDRTGKPAFGEFKIGINEIEHTGTVIVDTRSASKEPLVFIDYICDKLPLNIDKSMFGAQDIAAVPSITTKSKLDVALSIFEDEGFNLSGTGLFNQMVLTAQSFEPEFVSTIYLNTLKNINSAMFKAECGYTQSKGLNLDFSSDVDKQFMSAFTKELKAQLSILAKDAEAKLIQKLNELTNGALGDIKSFEDIYAKLNEFQDKAKGLSKQFEAKINEVQNLATQKATQAVEDAKQKAQEEATKQLKNLLKF